MSDIRDTLTMLQAVRIRAEDPRTSWLWTAVEPEITPKLYVFKSRKRWYCLCRVCESPGHSFCVAALSQQDALHSGIRHAGIYHGERS